MADDKLFGELPEQPAPRANAAPSGAPRLREPKRNQIELRAVDIESLIGEEHPVRVIWAYVEGLDLSELEDRIKARDERPGHPATSPRLLLALWLYATSEGVGSGRALERLCESQDVYRWLCGGVSVNHHTLTDFRIEHAVLLDRLLAEHLAALAKAGLVDLDTLAQDGVRIRASAGAASFRREATLDRHLATAQAVVDELRREVETRSDASNQRIKAAKERAARERLERVKAAQAALADIKRQREAREDRRSNGKKPKEPRASTTDPQARVMKMSDGGFRPGYNVQVVSSAGEQIVVGFEVTNVGSDRGLMRPMQDRLRARTGRLPRRYLVDGGFGSAEDIEWAHDQGIEVFCPPTQSKHGTDPCLPRRGDGPGVLAWRTRMASEAGKAQYKPRSICECIHARWRNWNLRLLTVRGIEKVRAAVLWYALANNILQGHRLANA
ncbi:IS1182 family transposase [Bradyrhizobium sp. INPA01-394B]|uniref:IS1182 family transposase n=1 Tax=Bradyrhizobium campsiandrae TaxID=1729892 RepID=A0ABR7UBE6_9BRAD|nr:IS1182 family transposase [Bradyrhizobium campsiandrae]MBC9878470.1 IS1182 family transposase [Bradyrhizobium campsiandrae]MBC9981292.1 IS1182 family transposase [Bradyrhizobium campsiandrae]